MRPDEQMPLVDVTINNTVATIDDYVQTGSSNRVICSARIVNHYSFSSDVSVRIRGYETTNGGRVDFSTSSGGAGASEIIVSLPADGSAVDFYVIGVTANVNAVYGDIAIEVKENRTSMDEIILARKALMVTNSPPAVPTELVEVQVGNSSVTIDDYITWSPKLCRARISNPASVSSDLTMRLFNASYGGQVDFAAGGSLTAHNTTAGDPDLQLTLPADGSWVNFYIAGRFEDTDFFGSSSTRDKDAIIEARNVATNERLGRWAFMIRVRKNADSISIDERDRFLEALAQLNSNFGYEEFFRRHNVGDSEAHGGPGFLPWHRTFVLQLERELQAVDPSVALHYWRFDLPAPNVFHQDFMGDSYNFINPSSGTPPQLSDQVTFSMSNPLYTWNTDGVNGIVRRTLFPANNAPSIPLCGSTTSVESETSTLARGGVNDEFFDTMGSGAVGFYTMEGNPHGFSHMFAGGFNFNCFSGNVTATIGYLSDVAISPRDPLFFLLHSNVDRLWAKWQWVNDRLDPSLTESYSPTGAFSAPCPGPPNSQTAIHIGHYADDTMWPWNEATGPGPIASCVWDDRPTTTLTLRNFPQVYGQAGAPGPTPTPKDMVDYRSIRLDGNGNPITNPNAGMSFCYHDVNF